jgi:hypothetical protein
MGLPSGGRSSLASKDGEGGTALEAERAWHRIERLHAQRFGDPVRQDAFEVIA